MKKNPNNRDQKIHQVWFPGSMVYRRWYKAYLRAFRCCTVLMMDMIAQLTLGLEFDPALVEDGIKVNHKTPWTIPQAALFTYWVDRPQCCGGMDS